jgi:hypothetical protein
MPEPVTVWMVPLASGTPSEVEGTLRLGSEALVFEPATKPAELRFPYATVTKVRRVVGSPVIVVEWNEDAQRKRTAFYFAQPPPLHPPTPDELMSMPDRPRNPIAERRALSKRRHVRSNLGYLAMRGRGTKPTVQAWTSELRMRVRDARS